MAQAIIDSEIFREACFEGKLNEVMNHVIEKSANINDAFYEEDGGHLYKLWTPLRLAAYKGHLSIVNFLLSCPNINIDDHDLYKRRALSIACHRGFTDMFKLLLLHGAKIPTTMCCGVENQEIGCSINMLMEASWNGNTEIVGHIVDEKIFDINEQDTYGRTALHIACSKPAIPHNADPDDPDIIDLNFSYDCIILLFLNIDDVDITLQNTKGETSYQLYMNKKEYLCDEILRTFSETLDTSIKKAECVIEPSAPTLVTPVRYFLRELGVEYLYTDEIELFENDCTGKQAEDTILYKILKDFVEICDSFGFGIELKYFEHTKLLQLSCFWKENKITYTTNGKEYTIHSPKIVYEEQIYHGTSCATMYVHKFTPPPMMGWGWKMASHQSVVRNKDTFNETFVNFILKIT